MFNPEAIEVALWTEIQKATNTLSFQTMSRHAKIWGDVDPSKQPALFLCPLGGETTQDQAFGIPRYHLKYSVVCYTRAEENADDPPPQTLLNQVWAAIDGALRAKPSGNKQTLGGLVENAWIDGEVIMQAGILDKQCALEMHISALTGL